MSTLEIIEMIEDFLETKVPSKDGNFAPVSDDDIVTLSDILNALVEGKWEADADGDFPVNTYLINRNVYQNWNFAPVTYRSVDKLQHQKDVVFNVGQAIAEMKLYLDLNDIEERNAK